MVEYHEMQVKHFFGLKEKEHHGLGERQFLNNITKCGVDPNSFVVEVGVDKINKVMDTLQGSISTLDSERGRKFNRFMSPRVKSVKATLEKLKEEKTFPASAGEGGQQVPQAFDENAIVVPYAKVKENVSAIYMDVRESAPFSKPIHAVAAAAVKKALEKQTPGGGIDLRQFIDDIISHERVRASYRGSGEPTKKLLAALKKTLGIR